MTNKNILLVMLAITLVFGLTFMGCDEIKDVINPEGDGNPFKGDWSGTFTPKVEGVEGDEIEATITFTDTRWTLTAQGINQSGPYSDSIIPSIGSSKTVDLEKDGITIATATYASLLNVKSLTVKFILGAYSGSSGSFKSGGINTSDSFIGTWNGNYTPSEGDETTATITFTESSWTLKVGTTTTSGTYEKSSIGYTATLKVSGVSAGTAVLNPITGKLSVNILLSNSSGSGSFTRAP
jgi:hypothetical protein